MADIFLSHARENRDQAARLAKALRAAGWSVWYDDALISGDLFARVIDKEINAARAMVVLWSKAALASKWVEIEVAAGLDRSMLVPAKLETDLEASALYRPFHTADLSDWDGSADAPEFLKLVEGITRKCGPPRAAGTTEGPHEAAVQPPPTPTQDSGSPTPAAAPNAAPFEQQPQKRRYRPAEILRSRAARRTLFVVALAASAGIALSLLPGVIGGFPEGRVTDTDSSTVHSPAPGGNTPGEIVVRRAYSAVGRGMRYGLGTGGFDPALRFPQRSDATGFVVWALGIPRELPPGSGRWLTSDLIWSEGGSDAPGLFEQVDREAARPGDIYVFPSFRTPDDHQRMGQMGIITRVGPDGPTEVIYCSVAADQRTGDCIETARPGGFGAGAARIMRLNRGRLPRQWLRPPEPGQQSPTR